MLGRETQPATPELGLDGRDFAGSCDEGFSCAYTNTIAWANETTPLPMVIDSRVVFERLFGDNGSTDPAVRKARLAGDASLLDSVTEQVRALSREIGPDDRAKLNQYLEAVRDIECRIRMAEARSDRELPVMNQPPLGPLPFETWRWLPVCPIHERSAAVPFGIHSGRHIEVVWHQQPHVRGGGAVLAEGRR